MIITKTPYRLSFFGGGTDYNPWFEENSGLVIASAISKYCYISLRRLPPFFEHKTRVVYSDIERVRGNTEIRHPSVLGCLKYMNISEGLEIHTDGDLPARSGIGSSSSFTVGMLLALNSLNCRMLTKRELAEAAIEVEQKVIGETVGIQDQIMASFGGLQVIEMGPGKRFKVNPLILPEEYQEILQSHIMLGFTGFTRTASNIAKNQIQSIENGKTKNQLLEIYSIAKEGLELFRKNADFKEIGKLFDLTWKLKRSLSDDISSSNVDSVYSTAMANGAYGGRLMGAGGGGFVMFLAPPELHAKIRCAIGGGIKVWVPFAFDEDGAQVLLHSRSEYITPLTV